MRFSLGHCEKKLHIIVHNKMTRISIPIFFLIQTHCEIGGGGKFIGKSLGEPQISLNVDKENWCEQVQETMESTEWVGFVYT